MTAKRKTSKEPQLKAGSAFEPVVLAGKRLIELFTLSAKRGEQPEFFAGKIEGVEAMIALCQRAGAGEIILETGQRLVKVVSKRAELSLEERVVRLEEQITTAGPAKRREARTVTDLLSDIPQKMPKTGASTTADEDFKGLRILRAYAMFPEGLPREKAGLMADHTKNTRNLYIGSLIRQGYLDDNEELPKITQKGVQKNAAFASPPLFTGTELQRYYINKLGGGMAALFEAVVRAYPKAVERKTIKTAEPLTKNTRNLYLSKLIRMSLLKKVGSKQVIANSYLFEG